MASTEDGGSKDLFPGELDWIDTVDVDEPVTSEAGVHFWQYARVYGEAAKRAQDSREVEREGVYRFIQLLLGMSPSFDDPAIPYAPSAVGPGWRNPIPADLTTKDHDAISRILGRTKDQALRARLLDYRFVTKRPLDYRAARESVEATIAHVEKLKTEPKAHDASYMLHRALQIVRLTGQWNTELGKKAKEVAIAVIKAHGIPPYSALFCRLLNLAREFDFGDFEELIGLAKSAGEHHRTARNEDLFRTYWTRVLEFEQRLNNLEHQRAAHREMGESYLRQIEIRIEQPGPANSIAADYVKRAVVAFRQGGEEEARIRELIERQRDYESRIGDEMGVFEGSVDIKDAANGAMEHVKADSLFESLMKLAFGDNEVSVAEVKREVLEQAKENPLFAILNVSLLDSKGRQAAVQRGLLNLEGEQYEQALLERMIAHAAKWNWDYRASAFINPARVQLLRQWNPSLEDLVPLVQYNPFIPPGHEASFLRGIHAGIHGNLFVATHLLVPQLENSIRHVLARKGVPVTKLEADMSEPFKTAGGLLALKETEEIFGVDNLFEMRGVLYSEFGYNLRHRIAHGMATETECQSERGLNAWWMILRFCLHPLLGRLGAPTPPAQEKQDVATDTSNP